MEPVWLLLHILVLVYWLGGDLGAFYASRLVVDAERPPAGRIAAATILLNVDMAPRMGLIFALPTGLALAHSVGWLVLPTSALIGVFAIAIVWAAAAWIVHLKTGPQSVAKVVDTGVRFLVLIGLVLAGSAGFAGVMELPAFLAGKLLLLGLAIFAGLMIRRALAPFGPAFAKLASGQGDVESDAAIAASLAHAKRYVFVIWAALLAAAALGVTTPA